MSVLEIIAEQRLGIKNLADHPRLRAALQRIEQSVRRIDPSGEERARIASLVELCFAYEAEPDAEARANILRSLEEISENEPIELPTETIEEWELNPKMYGFPRFENKCFSYRLPVVRP